MDSGKFLSALGAIAALLGSAVSTANAAKAAKDAVNDAAKNTSSEKPTFNVDHNGHIR